MDTRRINAPMWSNHTALPISLHTYLAARTLDWAFLRPLRPPMTVGDFPEAEDLVGPELDGV